MTQKLLPKRLLIFIGCIHGIQGLAVGVGRKLYHGPTWSELSGGNGQCGVTHRLPRESMHKVAGERSARIIGGFKVEAPIPWQAIIQREKSPGNWEHICGGSLISEHHIIVHRNSFFIDNQDSGLLHYEYYFFFN